MGMWICPLCSAALRAKEEREGSCEEAGCAFYGRPITKQDLCAHVIPYLTSFDCERCGVPPEVWSATPAEIRREIEEYRANCQEARGEVRQ